MDCEHTKCLTRNRSIAEPGLVTPIFEKLIDKKQLADLMGASISFIEKKMKLGLPHLKDGKFVRFRYSEVVTWFERRARRS